MDQKTERNVYVALSDSNISEIDLLKILSEAEIDLSTVKFINEVDEGNEIGKEDALVVVLFDSIPENEISDAAVKAAAQAGCCNIGGIWATDQNENAIHPALAKFGTAQIPWDSEKLKNELGSDCVNVFQTPHGDQADPKEIDPNECD